MAMELHVWFKDHETMEDDFSALTALGKELAHNNRDYATAIEFEVVEVSE